MRQGRASYAQIVQDTAVVQDKQTNTSQAHTPMSMGHETRLQDAWGHKAKAYQPKAQTSHCNGVHDSGRQIERLKEGSDWRIEAKHG